MKQDKSKLTRFDYFFAEAVRTLWTQDAAGYSTDFPEALTDDALRIAKAMERKRR